MDSPEISVVLPVRNGERTLAATMDALVAQTCTSMEVVIVDDGSTDTTAKILAEYDDPRLRMVHQTGHGVWHARKQGIALTTGRYVGFCDADDLPDRRLYETLVTSAKTTGSDMVVTAYRRIARDTGHLLGVEMARRNAPVMHPDRDPHGFASVNTAMWNKLFDGGTARRVGKALEVDELRFDPRPRRAEDMLFLALCLPWLRTVSFVDEPLYDYVVRPDATMTLLTPSEADDLAGNLAAIRAWVMDHAEDDAEALAGVVDAMAFVHLGLSALVNMGPSLSRRDARAYWRHMRGRLVREFPHYRDHTPRAQVSGKLRAGLWLERCHALLPAARAYVAYTKTTGQDARW
ncbi:MAG: glycosyltransferase [Micrococcales bacterium]|nr:glycosyltransferase [Micrococcales bacterium]